MRVLLSLTIDIALNIVILSQRPRAHLPLCSQITAIDLDSHFLISSFLSIPFSRLLPKDNETIYQKFSKTTHTGRQS